MREKKVHLENLMYVSGSGSPSRVPMLYDVDSILEKKCWTKKSRSLQENCQSV